MTITTKTIKVAECDVCRDSYDPDKEGGRASLQTYSGHSNMSWKDLCPYCLKRLEDLLAGVAR